jgi:hypothetical protein
MTTKCANGNIVETWYDRQSQNYVCIVKDPEGNQIGDADYSGCRTSMEFAEKQAVKQNSHV